jgi:LysM repeat protein
MAKLIRSFILAAIMVSVLAACSLTTSSTTDQSVLPIVQATASLAELVKIELTVQVDTSVPYNTVGQFIKFKYSIKAAQNGSSNIPANITVTGAALTCPALNTVGNLDDRLDQGETIECASDYAITQADLDKGSVVNIATANVYTVNSNQVTTTVPTVPAKALTLTKTANPSNYDRVGQIVTYNYVIKNSGSQSLGPAQFTVTDVGFGSPINCGDANLTLASNATVNCSANYTVTQADMNAVSVATSATASGGGAGPSQSVSATVTKGAVTQSNLTPGSTIPHTVVEGEWLWQIARCYGADPATLILANPQLSNPAMIKKDMIINVPNIGSAGKIYGKPCIGTHTVKAGETWASIAQMYNADSTVLQMVNSTLAVGSILKVPLNSAGTTLPTTTTGATGICVDLTRSLRLAGVNPNPTHFKVCGSMDASGNMKIGTIKVFQRPEDVGLGGLSQDITLPSSMETATPVNDANSLIVGDMNYDGNDDFRIVRNLPAGPNIPYVYYIYDPAARLFVYNEEYGKIRSPEFPGNNEIRSQWRKSAANWGIDTYTITNNIPRLIRREEWTAINETQATHTVTVFNADGTSQVTVNETIPLPAQ